MDKSKQKIAPDTNTSETTPSTPMPEEPVVQTEEESTVTAPVEEETTEEKKV